MRAVVLVVDNGVAFLTTDDADVLRRLEPVDLAHLRKIRVGRLEAVRRLEDREVAGCGDATGGVVLVCIIGEPIAVDCEEVTVVDAVLVVVPAEHDVILRLRLKRIGIDGELVVVVVASDGDSDVVEPLAKEDDGEVTAPARVRREDAIALLDIADCDVGGDVLDIRVLHCCAFLSGASC